MCYTESLSLSISRAQLWTIRIQLFRLPLLVPGTFASPCQRQQHRRQFSVVSWRPMYLFGCLFPWFFSVKWPVIIILFLLVLFRFRFSKLSTGSPSVALPGRFGGQYVSVSRQCFKKDKLLWMKNSMHACHPGDTCNCMSQRVQYYVSLDNSACLLVAIFTIWAQSINQFFVKTHFNMWNKHKAVKCTQSQSIHITSRVSFCALTQKITNGDNRR